VSRSLLAAVEERWLVPAYSSPRAPVWVAAHEWLTVPFRLQGEVRRYEWPFAGQRLTVVTAGAPGRLRQFAERITGPLTEASLGASLDAPVSARRALWRPAPLADSCTDAGADLVVAQIHRWAAPRFRRAGWHVIPSAVRWHGELARIPPSPCSNSLRDDLRKVRRYGYQVEAAETATDWDEFYATMVVPQAERRFGDAAWIPSPAFLRTLRKAGVLLFVCRAGARVGGFCLVPSGDRVWCPLLGTLAGDESLRREGVLAAVYAFAVDWAKRRGYRIFDMGRTSPFASDGIAAYKRKWGLAPVPDPLSALFAVKLGAHPAAAEMFAREPVTVETERGLATFAGEAP
jgi:GNAT superfamily N-acetyltransferase